MSWPARRLVVGVFYGGRSVEHAVSCSSAASVVRNLDRARYDVIAIGMARDGSWHRLPPAELARHQNSAARLGLAIDDQLPIDGPRLDPGVLAELDVAFPVLHGPGGEDGSLQGLFEIYRLPYVGAGVLASALAMDKVATKRALTAAGLDTAAYRWFDEVSWAARPDPLAALGGLPGPWFVKPANLGSSVGITRVVDPSDLAAAIDLAFDHDAVVLVEEGVEGARELECGVLGGFSPAASVVGEVRVSGGWFDFDQKYLSSVDPMTVPADLPPAIAARVRAMSVAAFVAIGGWGLARVDFLWQPDQDRLVVNELNTMPGFTAHSMYPKVWAATGRSYAELLSDLIDLALDRRARSDERAARRERRAADGDGARERDLHDVRREPKVLT